jgi:ParB family chromosome partitioning protein
MEKRSHMHAVEDPTELEMLREENRRLQRELDRARAEIDELAHELEEKALALASARNQAPQTKPQPSPPRVSSLIRSALATGASQGKLRAAFLEEELGRQAERHANQIARMEAHFVAKLAEVAGGGPAAVSRALQERVVELEKLLADPPELAQARATIGRLQAELEELREENRFLSAEVERWAALAQSK